MLAWRVVEYLQAVTGQSSEEGQLRALHRMLDPEAAGAALDLPTFHAIMREWIASCQQEGSVPGDQGQKAVPRVPAGTTDSSHLSRGPRFAEEWDVAAGDLGLVLAGGCRRRKGPRGGRGESVPGGAASPKPQWGRWRPPHLPKCGLGPLHPDRAPQPQRDQQLSPPSFLLGRAARSAHRLCQ